MAGNQEVKITVVFDVKNAKDLEKVQKAFSNLEKSANDTTKKTKQKLKEITPEMEALYAGVEKLARHWGVSWQTALPYFDKMRNGMKLTEKDTYALATATDVAAKKAKASWKQMYDVLGKKLEVGFKGISGIKSLDEITPKMEAIWKTTTQLSAQLKVPFEKALPYAERLDKSFKILETDTIKLFQASSKLSLEKNLPFSGVITSLRPMFKEMDDGIKKSKELKQELLSINKIRSTAQKVSITTAPAYSGAPITNTIAKGMGLSIQDATQYFSKLGVGAKQASTDIGTATNKMAADVGKNMKKMGGDIQFSAWHFRYLGSIAIQTSQTIYREIKKVVENGIVLQESFLSMGLAAKIYGVDAKEAEEITRDFAATGLLTFANSAGSVRDLMLTGMGLPQAKEFLTRFIDVAGLASSSGKELSASVKTMTESILRGGLVLSKDVASRALWDLTNKRLKATIGGTLTDLSAQQRAIEILTTIEEDFAATQGVGLMEQMQMSAALQRVTNAWQDLSNEISKAFQPAIEKAAELMTKFGGAIKNLVKSDWAPFVASLVILTSFILLMVGGFLQFISVAVSVGNAAKAITGWFTIITTATGAQTFALYANVAAWWAVAKAAWPIYAVMAAVAGILTIITWKWTKQAQEMMKLNDKTEVFNNLSTETKKVLGDAQKAATGFATGVADINERITELKKDLSLKNRDYSRELAELVKKNYESWMKEADSVAKAKKKMEDSLTELSRKNTTAIEDENIEYQRKKEDILQAIAEESSKGLWANQLEIAENRKKLARLEEDHTRALDGKADDYEESKKTILQTYIDELETAKKTMSEIATLWNKYPEVVAQAFLDIKNLPDEIGKIMEKHQEDIKDVVKELKYLTDEAGKAPATIANEAEKSIPKVKSAWNILGVSSFKEFQTALTDPTVWKNIAENIATKTLDIASTIGSKLILAWDWVQKFVPKVAFFFSNDFLKALAEESAKTGIMIGKAIGEGLLNAFKEPFNELIDWINEKIDEIPIIGGSLPHIENIETVNQATQSVAQAQTVLNNAISGTSPGNIYNAPPANIPVPTPAPAPITTIPTNVSVAPPSVYSLITTTPAYTAPTVPEVKAPTTPTVTIAPTITWPQQSLMPGTTSDVVKQLQSWLVKKGYLTQAQMNTGPGIYGPQTTAAVLTLQKAIGVDYSTGPGYWGPRTMEALKVKGIYQFGGIVPGMRSQAVPIMAHGGERIIPAGETKSSTGYTFNFYNPSFKNEDDKRDLINQIKKALGLDMRHALMGA